MGARGYSLRQLGIAQRRHAKERKAMEERHLKEARNASEASRTLASTVAERLLSGKRQEKNPDFARYINFIREQRKSGKIRYDDAIERIVSMRTNLERLKTDRRNAKLKESELTKAEQEIKKSLLAEEKESSQ